MLAPLGRFLRGDDSTTSMLTSGPSANRTSSKPPSKRKRWLRILYVALPSIALLNYLVLYQWTFFETALRSTTDSIFPPHSFHPAPFQETPHGLESQDRPGGGVDYWTWSTKTAFGVHDAAANRTAEEDGSEGSGVGCETFPTHLLERVQVVLKTGSADHYSRAKAQLRTVVKCIPNLIVVSDNNYTYGDSTHEAVDVLAMLPPDPESYLADEDFAIYTAQHNTTQSSLKQGHEGWKLDKYKFLPQIEYAVSQRPRAEWFVFLESDTYIVWDSVFRLLENYDPALPYYLGSPSPGRLVVPGASSDTDADDEGKVWFAYGGSGFVLSTTAAHRLVDRTHNAVGVTGPSVSKEFMQDILADCCGDSILGWAMHEKAGVGISGLWPMFSPHSLGDVPLGERYWCEPVISLHKMPAEDFEPFWEWEMGRDKSGKPLLYADIPTYHALGTFTRRRNWDAAYASSFPPPPPHNISAHTSFPACEQACKETEPCRQWTYHGRRCYMSSETYLGRHKDPDGEGEEEDRRYVSGWDTVKIERWRSGNACREGPHWVRPSVRRRF